MSYDGRIASIREDLERKERAYTGLGEHSMAGTFCRAGAAIDFLRQRLSDAEAKLATARRDALEDALRWAAAHPNSAFLLNADEFVVEGLRALAGPGTEVGK